MAVMLETPHRTSAMLSSSSRPSGYALEDRFEVIKEIGDGSFGSVVLARVRTAGANVARRGSVIAIKTMKKTFDSFAPCLELREVVFLRTLPPHCHLVPALDIFLDPYSKKLHIAMEHMEGNLYQLMKSRDHKCLDNASVKSILFQIMQGLEHIHAHSFFHRDIKPENILVSTSAHQETNPSFRRYSALVTPPSTPPSYTVKIADFGLARETHSKLPYTTYVSTRWYRAPEVLLRAGEYSAPVDIWAVGAMAVEVATLKPLFPGGNEVDQVWRVCEVMGSPGNWYNKAGVRVGGGDWKDGTRLAGKLGFSFPKMAPHAMDTILQQPQWPAALSQFVTWCLMWDPKARPTSTQTLSHEYFNDAVDPLRPRSSASKMLSRKRSDIVRTSTPPVNPRPSWFRKSLIGRTESTDVPHAAPVKEVAVPQVQPKPAQRSTSEMQVPKARPTAGKRATWANGTSNGAPMLILPTIRPISPLPDAVTAQADCRTVSYSDYPNHGTQKQLPREPTSQKIGRQLSVNSSTNHYAEIHRQQAERALNGHTALPVSPTTQKEGFFSHLRKRARRFSGRHQTPASPIYDDIEAQINCGPWASNRSSMILDSQIMPSVPESNYESLDKAVKVKSDYLQPPTPPVHQSTSNSHLKRHHSVPQQPRSVDNLVGAARAGGPISSRTRRAQAVHGVHQYDVPDEEDELLHDELASTRRAMRDLEAKNMTTPNLLRHSYSNVGVPIPYPTPSPSANGHSILFADGREAVTPKSINLNKRLSAGKWPTPPYEESEWAASASASIWAAGNRF